MSKENLIADPFYRERGGVIDWWAGGFVFVCC